MPGSMAIEDVVADGELRFRSGGGASGRVRVKIGRPRHLSDVAEDDWFCPVWMEGLPEVKCFAGAGPIDSLMNAMDWVRSRCEELESAAG